LQFKKNVFLERKFKTSTHKMKKVLSMIAVAALSTAFVACGPSKEEMEKREQARQDSIAAVEKAKQDSIAAAAAEAERMAEANAMRVADSTRMADSVAAASKKGGKKK
jgi:hypothetical protein